MRLTSIRVLIVAISVIVTTFAIVAAFALFLLPYRLGFYVRRNIGNSRPLLRSLWLG